MSDAYLNVRKASRTDSDEVMRQKRKPILHTDVEEEKPILSPNPDPGMVGTGQTSPASAGEL